MMDIYIYRIGRGKLCFNDTETETEPAFRTAHLALALAVTSLKTVVKALSGVNNKIQSRNFQF